MKVDAFAEQFDTRLKGTRNTLVFVTVDIAS